MLPPPLLPNHHQISKAQFPKLVMMILASLQPTTNVGERRVGTSLVVPWVLLSPLVVTIDKQPFVLSLPLLVGWVMMVSLLREMSEPTLPTGLSGFVPITLTAPVGFEPATSSSALPAYSAISETTIILHSSRHPSLQDNPSAAHGIAHRPSASRART